MRIGLEWFGGGLGEAGGVQVYVRALAHALADHAPSSHDLVLVGGDMEPRARFSTAPMPDRRRSPRVAAFAAAQILVLGGVARDGVGRAIDALGLDIIHYPATRIRELGLQTPAVLTFFDMQEEFLPGLFSGRERWARRLSHRASVAQARLVIAPSRFTAECLSTRFGIPEKKVVLVPVGVSHDYHPGAVRSDEDIIRSHSLHPKSYVLYPAHTWPHKNHSRLLAALQLVKQRTGRSLPLVCTGTLTGFHSGLDMMAASAGLVGKDVRDLGFVDAAEMPALYRGARALVFPSQFEGFGIPVLEAMASGCPVAAADATALPELAGGAARLFDPGDVGAMANAVEAVSDDETLRAELRERGLARAEQYRWEHLVPRLLETYERAHAQLADRAVT